MERRLIVKSLPLCAVNDSITEGYRLDLVLGGQRQSQIGQDRSAGADSRATAFG